MLSQLLRRAVDFCRKIDWVPAMWSALDQFVDSIFLIAAVNGIMLGRRANLSQWTSSVLKVLLALAATGMLFCLLTISQCHSPSADFLFGQVGKLVLALAISFCFTCYLDYYCHQTFPGGKVSPAHKAVLITGCDSGFGFETALRLYCSGYHVFAGCLEPGINGALTLSKVDGGRRLVPIGLDVTDQDQIDAAYKIIAMSCKDNQLELWALINNAGVATFSELEICSMEVYSKVLDVNTMGTVRMTKQFLPLLRFSQGRVIMVSSLAGCLAYPGLTAYCMSKHAVEAFADCLRGEVKRWNISVTTIACTGYRTHMLNPIKLMHDIESQWNLASAEIRQVYGEDYFQKFCKNYVKRLTSVNKNIGEAVDTIVTAVESTSPRNQYFTCFKGQLRSLARYLSPQWQDVYMKIFESFEPFFSQFNKPKTAPVSLQLRNLLSNLEESVQTSPSESL